jgi:hypothetical protein
MVSPTLSRSRVLLSLFQGTNPQPYCISYLFRSMFYMLLSTLTIEEWKTEQQLFAKAVSVNSRASFR